MLGFLEVQQQVQMLEAWQQQVLPGRLYLL
jgi:hypothetical protein